MWLADVRTVTGPGDVTFSDVGILGGVLIFGLIAWRYNLAHWQKSADPGKGKSMKAVADAVFVVYATLAGVGFVWALYHAIENSR